MGFGHRWLSWINRCISTTTFSILINGSLVGIFWSSRGLSQGDPLFPYLFVLGMGILSRLINKVVDGNYLTRCKFGVKGEEEDRVLSHLLYVDDTLLFCKASPDQPANPG